MKNLLRILDIKIFFKPELFVFVKKKKFLLQNVIISILNSSYHREDSYLGELVCRYQDGIRNYILVYFDKASDNRNKMTNIFENLLN